MFLCLSVFKRFSVKHISETTAPRTFKLETNAGMTRSIVEKRIGLLLPILHYMPVYFVSNQNIGAINIIKFGGL